MAQKEETPVGGVHAPPPRLTTMGKWLIVKHLIMPFLAILLLLDVALYLIFRFVFDRCYGLMCLF